MTSLLSDAIGNRLEVEFVYDNLPRIVRPAAVGLHISTGNEVLRGYQVGGASSSRTVPLWDLFLVGKIDGLVVTDRVFLDDPPNYSKGDKHMSPICREL